jgi:hypothetical protein
MRIRIDTQRSPGYRWEGAWSFQALAIPLRHLSVLDPIDPHLIEVPAVVSNSTHHAAIAPVYLLCQIVDPWNLLRSVVLF